MSVFLIKTSVLIALPRCRKLVRDTECCPVRWQSLLKLLAISWNSNMEDWPRDEAKLATLQESRYNQYPIIKPNNNPQDRNNSAMSKKESVTYHELAGGSGFGSSPCWGCSRTSSLPKQARGPSLWNPLRSDRPRPNSSVLPQTLCSHNQSSQRIQ